MTTITPGSTIGILGGGQLGRMIAIAAAQLGYRTHIYAPETSGPAADVSPRWTCAAYEDASALAAFADSVDVVTYEFENIDPGAVEVLSTHGLVRPGAAALRVAQDRLAEKNFVRHLGGLTAPFASVESLDDLEQAIATIGSRAILKTNRMGYDGKGQARLNEPGDAVGAWNAIGRQSAILEGFVTFEEEFSVILARSVDGGIRFWDSPANVHVDGILSTSIAPGGERIEAQVDAARALAAQVAQALDYVGVLTLEFFASADGPVFNEMAPRVHNSGHWTIEGAVTSQFENHVRAICGLPLGDTALAAKSVQMRNLIGEEANDWQAILADPVNHLHLYGKHEARPGRKMGHVTRLTL
ncbi:Phosphoribosylaminoimidazole carboxylase ATPase subunit [Sphingobium herbicidovorans NBRC 16415]|uniref:N5-carboxyaminoimidazole ribonucleotide synthase n=1 Tax=Sphingobium herbicidovorans (strain ATCC 700291 / DSM 11019 / CCUG 56400 / KCTC 2939 / LMG 18315 / NBRC 16415 / MH) TaxID=1219045 RepID=A0A086PFG7_SPHHM|nr:5-(carboxyamino)imidazole ribonucleotide synthase [Sphingobium herbicidovorans]KFG92135.1 Phosphoribosylaminoimidazole carboxylase ATPase subunit [Sphingobium herbicidovorans NBRC 16415]